MKKNILILLAVVLLVLLVIDGVYQAKVVQDGPNNQAIALTIKSGESAREVVGDLLAAKVINSPNVAKLYFWQSGLGKKLQAGAYHLPARVSLKNLTEILAAGQAINQEKTVLVKEGMSINEITAYLKQQNLITDSSFADLAHTKITALPIEFKNYDFLADATAGADLEGYLFPDTYRIYNQDNGQALIKKMLSNFDSKLTPDLRAAIKAQGKTIFQIITMASIVQKEVRSNADMKIVAGIFYNRLALPQRLQSCATLAYCLGVNKDQYSLADTQVDSPYNTYRHDGLPPGPISNPGLDAIEAAIYPQKTDYLYFLSRSDNGQTVFARTLAEHNANKAKYLK